MEVETPKPQNRQGFRVNHKRDRREGNVDRRGSDVLLSGLDGSERYDRGFFFFFFFFFFFRHCYCCYFQGQAEVNLDRVLFCFLYVLL